MISETKITGSKLYIPSKLLRKIRWRFPFHRIPVLSDYNPMIVKQCEEQGKLPFFCKLDINNDGEEEIAIVLKSIIGGYGKILIISMNDDQYDFSIVKWSRPINALYFDYLINVSASRTYLKKGLSWSINNSNQRSKVKKLNISHSHIRTEGYLSRVLWWSEGEFHQEKITNIY